MPERPGVIITMDMIYQELIGVKAKVDVLSHQDAKDSKNVTDHETRLRVLEKVAYAFPATLVTAVAALVAAFLT